MKLRWVMLLAAAVATLALLGAACGGGDDDDSGDDLVATATEDSGDGDDDSGDEETPEPTAEDTGDDDGGDDSSEDAVDACSLITTDEAEEALGAPVGDGEAQDFPPVYGCSYRTADGVGLVAVSVVVFDDADQAEAVYDLAIDNNDYQEIDGIGDRAYFALGFGLTAQQGRYEFTIDIIGPDDDRALEEELAPKALERLP
jgi:hypothetical protein